MKLAVVLGVAQMLVGLLLRFTNAMYEKNMVAWFYFCRYKHAASLDMFLEVSWWFISISLPCSFDFMARLRNSLLSQLFVLLYPGRFCMWVRANVYLHDLLLWLHGLYDPLQVGHTHARPTKHHQFHDCPWVQKCKILRSPETTLLNILHMIHIMWFIYMPLVLHNFLVVLFYLGKCW